MDVSDRGLQAKLTQEAKITSACFLSEVIFAFGGFVNALRRGSQPRLSLLTNATDRQSVEKAHKTRKQKSLPLFFFRK